MNYTTRACELYNPRNLKKYSFKSAPKVTLAPYMNHVGILNPLIANPTKWSNTLKQFVSILPTNCLSVFDRFVKLALKGLKVAHQTKVFKNFAKNEFRSTS